MKKFLITLAATVAALTICIIPAKTASAAATGKDATAATDTDGILEASGDYSTDEGFLYRVAGANCTITGYVGVETAVTLPLTIANSANGKTYDVVGIGARAFSGNAGIESVIISNSKANTGNKTGTGAGASTTTSKGIVTIGFRAFASCPYLRSVQISSTVTDIGDECFADCPSLESISVDAGCQNYRAVDGVLYGYDRANTSANYGTWTLLQYPTGSFNTRYTRPTNFAGRITTIGAGSFSGALNLAEVVLPDSVNKVEEAAFQNCKALVDINVPDAVTAIPANCFEGCTALARPRLTDNIKSIGNKAFKDCVAFQLEKLPANLLSIGDEAFINCTAMEVLEIPSKTTNLGAYSFADCTSLKKVTIPASVSAIGQGAFQHDAGITVYCHSGTQGYIYATSNSLGTVTTFTVRFGEDKNGNGKLDGDEIVNIQEVVYGSAAVAPKMEDRPGYKQTWSCKYNNIISDLDVIAKYTRVFTVRFVDDYLGREKIEYVESRMPATPPNWGVIGYQLSWDGYYNYITSDTVIKAVWTDPATGYVIGDGIKAPAQKGSELVTMEAVYKVVSADIQKPSVTYMYCQNAAAEEVEIPAVVYIDEIPYKVVGVGARAFENNPYLKKVTIGKNVTQIKGSAFKDCQNLSSILIKSKKITKIKKNAFTGIKDRASFKVYWSKKDTYRRMLKNSGLKSIFNIYSISGN